MKHITDDELRAELPHWVNVCRARGITELRPIRRVGAFPPIRLPWDRWMDPIWREDHNWGGHQDIPNNDHWDCGKYPYGEMADEVNKVLSGQTTIAIPKPDSKVVVSKVVRASAGTTTDLIAQAQTLLGKAQHKLTQAKKESKQ